MIALIYGNDNFRSGEYLNNMIASYQKQKPFYFSYDFDDNQQEALEIGQIKELITGRTLFASIKVIVFKNLLNRSSSDVLGPLFKLLEESNINKSKSILLIIYERADIKDKHIVNWFEKQAHHVKQFSLLKSRELSSWLDEESRRLGVKLTKESTEILIASFGSDTGMLHYALKKLSLLGPKNIIDPRILEENIWLPFSTNIFKFLDNLAQRQIASAIKLLMQEINIDNSLNHLLYLLSMITFEFRSLILVKENQNFPQIAICRRTDIKPYSLRKIYPLTKYFTWDELKKIYRYLLLCDERIKKGLMPAEIALKTLMLDLKDVFTAS
ncbi:MAG: DNA polymerase III subunit delta [Parcubacteria group bacterium]|nr:DNA polymerase III subunit delta [Parcubacteria group bacterium]